MSVCGASSTPIDGDSNYPLWRYVTKLDAHNNAGGNLPWRCNFCNEEKKSTYTRVRGHLLGGLVRNVGVGACKKVTQKDLLEMQILEEQVNGRTGSRQQENVPLSPLTYCTPSVDFKKRKGNAIEKAFNLSEREHLDLEIAKMFYSAGLPFNLARNPYFRSAFSYAANHNIAGYMPPGYNKLRTTLLQKERESIDRSISTIRSKWKENGVSIVSDGWGDCERRLINFMAVCDGITVFLKAASCSGETNDEVFISDLFKEVINEVGHEKVVQVITENVPNCKGAGQLIQQQFPTIVWTPCVVHTLNLALQNICAAKNMEDSQVVYDECLWIKDIVGDVVQIKNFIINHPMRLAIFNEFVDLKLFSVTETRFASDIGMLRRFKQIRNCFQAMVISDNWKLYRNDDIVKANFVRKKVLDDEWFDSIRYIISFTGPIYDMLSLCDTSTPCLHLVYDMWDMMIEKVKKVIYLHEKKQLDEESILYEVVDNILIDLWNKNNTPLHCLAHALNPRYYSDQWLQEDPTRVPPHKDDEINRERMKCIRKYFPNLEDRNKVNMEYAQFIDKSGHFDDEDSISFRWWLDAKSWWINYGSCAPMLQGIALRLLSQPSSSSCAERNWSTYGVAHSMSKKMTTKCGDDLVFVHNNLRLLSRNSPQYSEGETKMWDIGGDAFDSFEDVGVLGIANLSLDEPELEAMIFRNDGGLGVEGGSIVET